MILIFLAIILFNCNKKSEKFVYFRYFLRVKHSHYMMTLVNIIIQDLVGLVKKVQSRKNLLMTPDIQIGQFEPLCPIYRSPD